METSPVDRLRNRLRRGQVVLAAGFLSWVVGGLIASKLVFKLREHLPPMHSQITALLLNTAVSRLYVYAVLPAVCYALARAFPVTRWGLPIGAALTGETFYLAIELVSGGDLLASPVALAFRIGAVAIGVAISARAITAAQRTVAREQEKATAAAQAKADEYAAMLRESERLAERNEKRSSDPSTGTGA